MWERIKSLWSGRVPEIDDADEDESQGGSAPADESSVQVEVPESGKASSAPVQAVAPTPARDLRPVEAAVAEGELAQALALVRQHLLEAPTSRAVLICAAKVLEAAGEAELAGLFGRAAEGREQLPAFMALAEGFLHMDDPAMAAAMAEASLRGVQNPRATALWAQAVARLGDHDRVLEILGRFEGRWPDPGTLCRYALSAVLAGDRARYARVAGLVEEAGAEWITRAAARSEAVDADSDPQPLRHVHFVEYGATLLDAEERLFSTVVGPARIARILGRAAAVVDTADQRICYTSQRGEVFARWLAALVDGTAIPASARIPKQRALLVLADDDCWDARADQALDAGPTTVLQVVKDPNCAGVPTADLIGVLASGAPLPLEGIGAERASERVPPRLLAEQLKKAAEGTKDEGRGEVERWVEARKAWLSVNDPPGPSGRTPYLGDVPVWVEPDGEPAEVAVAPQ